MKAAARHVLLAAAVLALPACEKHEFHPPDAAARVAEAESAFAVLGFDSIAWASDSVRIQEGNTVFASNCTRCHGPLGRGETDYTREHDLKVPSLVEPTWDYAGDIHAVRRRVFAGHQGGMPTWGVAHLSPREVDAVAFYVLNQLRPEVLGEGTGSGTPE